jgi:hypothetical protein
MLYASRPGYNSLARLVGAVAGAIGGLSFVMIIIGLIGKKV